MSIKIGTIEALAHIPPEVLAERDHDRGHCRPDPAVDVYASSAGVELCAGCVVLSPSDAECLISLLSLAVRRAKGMASGADPERFMRREPPSPYVPTDAELAREDELKAEDRAQGLASSPTPCNGIVPVFPVLTEETSK